MSRGPAPRRGQYNGTNPGALSYEDTLSGDVVNSHILRRPTRDRVLLDIAHTISQRGTCKRALVGAVIARDGRIITTGYNGAPAGMPHCIHESWRVGQVFIPDWMKESAELLRSNGDPAWQPARDMVYHYDNGQYTARRGLDEKPPGCTNAEHAERNAIAYAARYGLGTDGSTLYTTHAPCIDCARAIINAGILRVVYEKPYRLPEGLNLLTRAGVEIIQLQGD